MSSSSSRAAALVGIVGASLTAAASYWTYRSVAEYGWDGTLRYVWEGDPYTPSIRKYIEILDRVEKSRLNEEIKTNEIEEALERARLDSVDDGFDRQQQRATTTTTTKDMVALWIANYSPNNLEKTLAGLSHTLDRLAAQVDGIVVSAGVEDDSGSKVLNDIKRRKKLLSKQLVLDMERCDALMTSYQVLNEK